MKLKYYLRGLGIGIIVTAVVMSAAIGNKTETMTDEQVKARAVELGMIEDTFLADAVKTMEETTGQTLAQETEQATVQVAEQVTEQGLKTVSGEETDKAAKITDKETKTDTEKELQKITVASGESSVSISRKLEQAGLVESATEYDRYLSQNGYDKKICTGVHLIAKGATKEEIAKEITTR